MLFLKKHFLKREDRVGGFWEDGRVRNTSNLSPNSRHQWHCQNLSYVTEDY